MKQLVEEIQVNIPYDLLRGGYLATFLRLRLNPEIGFDASSLDGCRAGEVRKIGKQLYTSGLRVTIHGPFMDLSPGSPDPEVRSLTRRRFEKLLEVIPLLLPKAVVCHAGYDEKRYGFMREAWTERCVETWAWLADGLKEEDVRLVLENVYERDPTEILPLFEGLATRDVGFCLDTGHQAAFGGVPLMEWVEKLEPYLEELHLHDNDGARDDHLAMGRGRIDFPSLFDRLKTMQRPLTVTLEPHREEDLWTSLEYLETIWPW